jgi:hypothetical protein
MPCSVCTKHKETRNVGFLVWRQNQNRWFPGLGHKTSSFGLVIWASKSPWRFLGLGLKTKLAMVYRLHHKTDGRKMVRDTHRDLAACFTWKQVGLGFPSLPQNWWRSDGRWCTWNHHGGRVKMKSKTNGSIWWDTSDSSTPTLLWQNHLRNAVFVSQDHIEGFSAKQECVNTTSKQKISWRLVIKLLL